MSNWSQAFDDLSTDFPIKSQDPAFPSLKDPLDHEIDDKLHDSLANPSPINPHLVEELLTDCIRRISNCLVVREKANEIEIDAISAASSYVERRSMLKAEESIRAAIASIRHTLGSNFTGTTISAGASQNNGNAQVWTAVGEAERAHAEQMGHVLDHLVAKVSEAGNGSNYVERFVFFKRLFDQNIVEAYRRALVCARALKKIYDVDCPVPTVKASGYLNELALWGQNASDMLDEKLDERVVGEIAFTVAARDDNKKSQDLLTRAEYNAMLPSRRITITLNQGHFDLGKIQRPLIRSMAVHARGKDVAMTRVWPLQITTPRSQVTNAELSVSGLASTSLETFEDAMIASPIHNLNPIGTWDISLGERALTGEDTTPAELTNLYLRMRVSYIPGA